MIPHSMHVLQMPGHHHTTSSQLDGCTITSTLNNIDYKLSDSCSCRCLPLMPASHLRNETDGVLGMYKTASCRTSLQLHLISPPANITIGAGQLYSAAETQATQDSQHKKTTAIVVPCVIGGLFLQWDFGVPDSWSHKEGSSSPAQVM